MTKKILLSLRGLTVGGWLKLAFSSLILVGLAGFGLILFAGMLAIALTLYALSRLRRSPQPPIETPPDKTIKTTIDGDYTVVRSDTSKR